jgi:AsmA protein
MPFSVTDVDFALWLPSPQQWHIRLQGKPARTDTNTNDTGTLRIEGTLGQAATLVDIPLSLAGSWAHAQMGEASRLFTGNDEGWRGTLETGITLTGTVGAAQLDTNLHVTDLRRADFVPAKLLDVSAHCTTAADIATLTITQAACAIPTGSAQPILISSPSLDLQEPGKAAITIALNQMPFAWALDWSRLFAQRVPNSTSATGTLDGQLTHPSNGDGIWSATLQSILVYANTPNRAYDFTSAPITTDWTGTLTPTSSSLAFQLSAPQPGTSRPLSFAGQLAPDQFGFTFDGVATMEQLQTFGNAILPPLGDDAVKSLKPAATESPIPVELACTLPHAAPETCTLERREPTPPPKSRHKH